MEAVLEQGAPTAPRSGAARELWGAALELDDPRARVSRSASRGKIFGALGELCWYLSGTGDAEFIRHYLPDYPNSEADGQVFGAYGPRLRGPGGRDQIAYVVSLLAQRPDSRRAVVQVYGADDGPYCDANPPLQPPCTCTMQFLVRDGALHVVTYMRSNDLWLGLPHDVFAFTMLQELVARSLGCALGSYVHVVGSLHLYEKDVAKATAYMGEGWQPTALVMPEMPPGDPWPAVERLLSAEQALRTGGPAVPQEPDPYWQDLVRLLAVHWWMKRKHSAGAAEALAGLRRGFVHRGYDDFVAERLQD